MADELPADELWVPVLGCTASDCDGTTASGAKARKKSAKRRARARKHTFTSMGSQAKGATLKLPRMAELMNKDHQEEEVIFSVVHSWGRHTAVIFRDQAPKTWAYVRQFGKQSLASLNGGPYVCARSFALITFAQLNPQHPPPTGSSCYVPCRKIRSLYALDGFLFLVDFNGGDTNGRDRLVARPLLCGDWHPEMPLNRTLVDYVEALPSEACNSKERGLAPS